MRKHRICHLLLALVLAVLMAFAPAANVAQAASGPESQPPVQAGEEGSAPEEEEPAPQPEPDVTPEPENTPEPEQEGGASPEPSPAPEGGDDMLTPPEAPEGEAQPKGDAEPEESPAPAKLSALNALKKGTHEPYLAGYAGNYFRPDRNVTRAEACVMLYTLLKEKPTGLTCKFSDVQPTDSYAEAVAAMNAMDVVGGVSSSSNLFAPNNPVTRAQFVLMLSKFFEKSSEESTASFSDVPPTHWAYKAVGVAEARGWVCGFSDGTFRPNNSITRAQMTVIINVALERRGEGYAADRDVQKFVDVAEKSWYYLDVTEAAERSDAPDPGPVPTPAPTPAPTPSPSGEQLPDGTKVGSTVRVNAETGLNIRSGPGTGNPVVVAVANGTLLTVTDISKYPWLGVKTSSGQKGYSLSDYLTLYTGNTGGDQNGTLSASSITMAQYQSARLDAKADSNISAMKWSSSNEGVAKVGYTLNYSAKEQSAIVYAGAPGTATLSLADGTGKVKASCTVTVTAPQSVRFAYGDGNSVPVKKDFDLVAVTDTARDEVRFDIISGPASGSYSSSAYEEEVSTSENGLPENRVRVFRRTVKFSAAGLYTLRAYSSQGGSYSGDYYTFTVLVTQADNATTATNETRRPSGKMLDMLAVFEGYVPEVEDDSLVSGTPTVGHGYVVTKTNNVFYNNLTRTEAYAMLVNTVNAGDYAKAVENFRKEHSIKMSQAQFDALVSFVYNCGTGALSTKNYDTPNIILNMVSPPTDASPSKPYSGTLNVVKAKMYSQASAGSALVQEVPRGSAVSVVGVQVNRSSTKQEVWYKAIYNGKTGWIASGYVKLSGSFARDLNYADSTSLANEFLQWHRAGGRCVPGLVYRRLAECKLFFFGNYEEAVNGHANYRKNTYGFIYPSCCKNLDQR